MPCISSVNGTGIPCVVRTREITKHVGKTITVSVKSMKDAYVEVTE